MKILIACEQSGTVRDAFIKLGHNAMSCDILETETPGLHHKGDIKDVLYNDWDLIIAFPPCTHIACSGARHFKKKIADGRQQQGIDFFMLFTDLDCPRVAIENPIGVMSTKYRKPDQIIQPYQFGDPARKSTCLWLKGLPLLIPTNIVEPKLKTLSNGKTFSADYMNGVKRSKAGDGSVKRSKTYQGIANAMADQWVKFVRGKID